MHEGLKYLVLRGMSHLDSLCVGGLCCWTPLYHSWLLMVWLICTGGLDIQRHIGSSLYTSKLALCQEILCFAYQLHAMPVRICHRTSFLFTPLMDKQSQRAGKVLQGVSQACGFAVVFPGCYCQSQRMKKALRDPICQASVMLRRAECKY